MLNKLSNKPGSTVQKNESEFIYAIYDIIIIISFNENVRHQSGEAPKGVWGNILSSKLQKVFVQGYTGKLKLYSSLVTAILFSTI